MKIVEWHEGGPLWAGDTENHPCGWYLYGGEAGPEQVEVSVPTYISPADFEAKLNGRGSLALTIVPAD